MGSLGCWKLQVERRPFTVSVAVIFSVNFIGKAHIIVVVSFISPISRIVDHGPTPQWAE